MSFSARTALTATNLLKLLTRRISRKKYLTHVVEQLQELAECRCAGIRMLHEAGTIPYEAYSGFSEEFWRAENNLSVLQDQCACIRVITGNHAPADASSLTPFGSFRLNNAIDFICALPGEERSRYRGMCQRSGFRSMALVPVKYRDETVAAIHLADERPDLFPPGRLEEIESLVPAIGEAIHKFIVEDKLRQHHALEHIVNMLMRMSLEEASIREICGIALEKVLAMRWFSFAGKGCIFLVKDSPTTLIMEVQRGLPRANIRSCSRVPFGSCFCGRAALRATPQSSAGHGIEAYSDFRAPERYGIVAIPLMNAGRVLGVMSLRLRDGQRISERQRDALSMIANTLAGIITRNATEVKLRDSQKALRMLAVHLQKSSEEERTTIARDVHDELGQSLTALKMELFWLKKRLPRAGRELIEKADESLELIDATINSVRRICTELRPDILDHLGLAAAIEWQVEELRRRTQIKCSVSITPNELSIDRDLTIAVFRIIQEALTNILRHSGATEMSLTLARTPERLSFRIADNGRGIPKRLLRETSSSLGLLGIRERVIFWNGEFRIESPSPEAEGRGTVIDVSIPLESI